jgi:hypothetical protein
MKKLLPLLFIITMVSCKKKDKEGPPEEVVFHFTSRTVVGTCDKYVTTMIQDSTKLYLVGDFTTIGGVASQSIISYDDGLQKFVSYNSNVSGGVSSFLPGKIDYIGGEKFGLNGSTPEFCLASKSSSSSVFEHKADNLMATPMGGGLSVIKKFDNEIYFAGGLKTLNGSMYFVPLLKLAGDSVYSFGSNKELPTQALDIWITDIEKNWNTLYFSRGYTDYPVWENNNGVWKEVAPNTFNFSHNGVSNLEVINHILYASTGASIISLVTNTTSSSSKWEMVGSSTLPGLIYDIQYNNGVLYACGANFLYALDSETNEWKSAVNTSLNLGVIVKIAFINGKCYALERDENYKYQLVRFNVN